MSTEMLRRAVSDSFLSALPEELVAPLLEQGVVIESPPRGIAAPSAYASRAALFLDGLARLYVSSPKGRQATIGYRRRGDLLVPFAARLPPLRVQAMTAVQALVIPMTAVKQWIVSDARIGEALARYVGTLLYTTVAEFRFGLFANVRQRVARHLFEMAMTTASGSLFAEVTVRELADSIGSVREVVSRAVRELERRRAIRLDGDGYAILEPKLLRADFQELLAHEPLD